MANMNSSTLYNTFAAGTMTVTTTTIDQACRRRVHHPSTVARKPRRQPKDCHPSDSDSDSSRTCCETHQRQKETETGRDSRHGRRGHDSLEDCAQYNIEKAVVT